MIPSLPLEDLIKLSSQSKLIGAFYYLRCKARKMPVLVNIEFTKHCNAKCSFCACWQVESKGELTDYSPVVKKFKPLVCSVSGGEPLLRKNYAELLAGIRPHCHYLIIITNGAKLNRESAEKLAGAGVNQISVSLDYLSSQHDENRKIEGLYEHIAKTVPELTALGHNIVLNTIIMESNLDEIVPIAHRAKEWGAHVSFSSFCTLKKDTDAGMVKRERQSQLISVIKELKHLKKTMGHIKNSDYYLDAVPEYFLHGRVASCKAGYNWLQVTPDGHIQQCSELPRICHYTEFREEKRRPTKCTKCWYTCRGESEASPFRMGRLMELLRI